MAENCLIMSCPEVVRIGLMDSCTGQPIAGASNGYAISCPRNWSLEPITREGEASEFISDCGYTVARDRQDDQLQGWTLSFETANRSNELESLVTGSTLISSGGTNIGTIGTASATCASPPDIRLYVEVFYKLSRCTTAANHVRYLIPNVQFKVTELDREGTITYYRYTGESSPSLASGVLDGPFNDLPFDVYQAIGALPAGSSITHVSFEETITISGSCGRIAIPDETVPLLTSAATPGCENLVLTGTNFDSVNHVIANGEDYYDPAGPDNALNPVGAVINSWTATTIDIEDDGLVAVGLDSVQLLGEDDDPDYGDYDFTPITITACP